MKSCDNYEYVGVTPAKMGLYNTSNFMCLLLNTNFL